MLVQFHAQNPADAKQTEFLMQGEVNSDEDMGSWLNSLKGKWEEFKDIRPEGWVPMVCTETYEGFVKASKPNDSM